MTLSTNPLVERRRVRDALRQARQDAGLTQETVADQMDWSMSKIIRIETGAVGISTNDLTALSTPLQGEGPSADQGPHNRGRAGRKPTWYSKYRQILSPVYFQYIEYETAASIIRNYEEILVPGLLQTEEYATSITRQYRRNFSAKTMTTLVEVRMKRQELLLTAPSLRFCSSSWTRLQSLGFSARIASEKPSWTSSLEWPTGPKLPSKSCHSPLAFIAGCLTHSVFSSFPALPRTSSTSKVFAIRFSLVTQQMKLSSIVSFSRI